MSEAFAQSADADCLYGKSRTEFIDLLRMRLGQRVLGAYLFGSVASDQYSRTSDVDLVLVAADLPSFFQRFKQFSDLFELCPRLDLLIYTPDEFRRQLELQTGFWSDFKKSALRII